MIFSSDAITCKLSNLDSIDAVPELIEQVVSMHLVGPYSLYRLERYWEPGGGATLFRIDSEKANYFLKVKHCSVFVESRLESELDFIRRPSLENEAHFLKLFQSLRTPKVAFYAESQGYTFLALELLVPFAQAVVGMEPSVLLQAWSDLESVARDLYSRGLVHTDLHEGNLCFRGNDLVVCDFEEARDLIQDVPFEESLDYCGENHYGNVGEFPAQTGRGIVGLTCLVRLREVFKQLIRDRLRSHLANCRFDQSCQFNADALQQEDPRIYQSIDLGGLSIHGHRPMRDNRKQLLHYLLFTQSQRTASGFVRHLDLGSNLGTFCFVAAQLPYVSSSLGLEAFDHYVDAANALRFLTDTQSATFRQFICGESDFNNVGYTGAEVCTMLSVYHHISEREVFLSSLSRNRPVILLAEFATQERYYPERGSVAEEIEFIRQRLGYRYATTLMRTADYRRPLILFTDDAPSVVDRLFFQLSRTRVFTFGLFLLRLIDRMFRKQLSISPERL